MHLNNLIKMTAGVSLLGLVMLQVFAAETMDQCRLGETCDMPSSISPLVIPVSKEYGQIYTCVVKSVGDSKISIMMYGSGGFKFPSQNISADRNGITTTITGKFDKTGRGQFVIRQTSTLNANGTIMCQSGG